MSNRKVKYAVVIVGQLVLGRDKSVMTQEGERFWVEKGEWGPTCGRGEKPSGDLMTWDTETAARKFAEAFDGHPWWVKKKSFEVVKVKLKYREVLDHYDVVGSKP